MEADTREKLKQIVRLWNEQTTKNKQIKSDKAALTEKTVKALANLTDEEVSFFLHKKWIDPVCQGIRATLDATLSALEDKVQALGKKYAVCYNQLDEELDAAQKELAELVEQLTGDEFTIQGLKELVKDGKE